MSHTLWGIDSREEGATASAFGPRKIHAPLSRTELADITAALRELHVLSPDSRLVAYSRDALVSFTQSTPFLSAPRGAVGDMRHALRTTDHRRERLAAALASLPTLSSNAAAASAHAPLHAGDVLYQGSQSLTHVLRLHRALAAFCAPGSPLASTMPWEALLAMPALVPAADSPLGEYLQWLNPSALGQAEGATTRPHPNGGRPANASSSGMFERLKRRLLPDDMDDGPADDEQEAWPSAAIADVVVYDSIALVVTPVPSWLTLFGDGREDFERVQLSGGSGVSGLDAAGLGSAGKNMGADGGATGVSRSAVPSIVAAELTLLRRKLFDLADRSNNPTGWAAQLERVFRHAEFLPRFESRHFVVRVLPLSAVRRMSRLPKESWDRSGPVEWSPGRDGPAAAVGSSPYPTLRAIAAQSAANSGPTSTSSLLHDRWRVMLRMIKPVSKHRITSRGGVHIVLPAFRPSVIGTKNVASGPTSGAQSITECFLLFRTQHARDDLSALLFYFLHFTHGQSMDATLLSATRRLLSLGTAASVTAHAGAVSLARFTEETQIMTLRTALFTPLRVSLVHPGDRSLPDSAIPSVQQSAAAAVRDYAVDAMAYVIGCLCAHDFVGSTVGLAAVPTDPLNRSDERSQPKFRPVIEDVRIPHVVALSTPHLLLIMARTLDESHAGSEEAYRSNLSPSVLRYRPPAGAATKGAGAGSPSGSSSRRPAQVQTGAQQNGQSPFVVTDDFADTDGRAQADGGGSLKQLVIPWSAVSHVVLEPLSSVAQQGEGGSPPQSRGAPTAATSLPRCRVHVFRLFDESMAPQYDGSASPTVGSRYSFVATGHHAVSEANVLFQTWLQYQARRCGCRANRSDVEKIYRAFMALTRPAAAAPQANAADARGGVGSGVGTRIAFVRSLRDIFEAPSLVQRLFLAACSVPLPGDHRPPSQATLDNDHPVGTQAAPGSAVLSFASFLTLTNVWLVGSPLQRHQYFARVLCCTNDGDGFYFRDLVEVLRGLSGAIDSTPIWNLLPSHGAQWIPYHELVSVIGAPNHGVAQRLQGLSILRGYRVPSADWADVIVPGDPLFPAASAAMLALSVMAAFHVAKARDERRGGSPSPPPGVASGGRSAKASADEATIGKNEGKLPWLDDVLPARTHIAFEKRYQHQRVYSCATGGLLDELWSRELASLQRGGEPVAVELCPDVFDDVRATLQISWQSIAHAFGIAQFAAAMTGGAFAGWQTTMLTLSNAALTARTKEERGGAAGGDAPYNAKGKPSRLFCPAVEGADHQLLVELLDVAAFQRLLRSLPKYERHLRQRPNSILPRYIGLFATTLLPPDANLPSDASSTPSASPSVVFFALQVNPLSPLAAAVATASAPGRPLVDTVLYVTGDLSDGRPTPAGEEPMPGAPLSEALQAGHANARLRFAVDPAHRAAVLANIRDDISLLAELGLQSYSVMVVVTDAVRYVADTEAAADAVARRRHKGHRSDLSPRRGRTSSPDRDGEDLTAASSRVSPRLRPRETAASRFDAEFGQSGLLGALSLSPSSSSSRNPLNGAFGPPTTFIASYNMPSLGAGGGFRDATALQSSSSPARPGGARSLVERSMAPIDRITHAAVGWHNGDGGDTGPSWPGVSDRAVKAATAAAATAQLGGRGPQPARAPPTWVCAMCGTENRRVTGGEGRLAKPCRTCFSLVEVATAPIDSAGPSARPIVVHTVKGLPPPQHQHQEASSPPPPPVIAPRYPDAAILRSQMASRGTGDIGTGATIGFDPLTMRHVPLLPNPRGAQAVGPPAVDPFLRYAAGAVGGVSAVQDRLSGHLVSSATGAILNPFLASTEEWRRTGNMCIAATIEGWSRATHKAQSFIGGASASAAAVDDGLVDFDEEAEAVARDLPCRLVFTVVDAVFDHRQSNRGGDYPGAQAMAGVPKEACREYALSLLTRMKELLGDDFI